MILDALIPIIQAAGIAAEGQDLFLHYMPATVTDGVLLLPSLAGSAINPQLPGFRNRDAFQVIARSGGLQLALDRANRLFVALTILQRRTLPAIPGRTPEISLNYLRPKHDPIPFPRQPSGGWEVSLNFTCSWVAQGAVF